jgi:hypothetical protein
VVSDEQLMPTNALVPSPTFGSDHVAWDTERSYSRLAPVTQTDAVGQATAEKPWPPSPVGVVRVLHAGVAPDSIHAESPPTSKFPPTATQFAAVHEIDLAPSAEDVEASACQLPVPAAPASVSHKAPPLGRFSCPLTEDLLGLTTDGADGHGNLGFAAQTGLVPFGKDVFK